MFMFCTSLLALVRSDMSYTLPIFTRQVEGTESSKNLEKNLTKLHTLKVVAHKSLLPKLQSDRYLPEFGYKLFAYHFFFSTALISKIGLKYTQGEVSGSVLALRFGA